MVFTSGFQPLLKQWKHSLMLIVMWIYRAGFGETVALKEWTWLTVMFRCNSEIYTSPNMCQETFLKSYKCHHWLLTFELKHVSMLLLVLNCESIGMTQKTMSFGQTRWKVMIYRFWLYIICLLVWFCEKCMCIYLDSTGSPIIIILSPIVF